MFVIILFFFSFHCYCKKHQKTSSNQKGFWCKIEESWVYPLMDGKDGSKKSGKNFSPSEGYEYSEGHEGVSPSNITY